MYLRKLWSAKLTEWLFGTGVAVACLAPIGASSLVKGGEENLCNSAQMAECVDNDTGLPCSVLSGDGSDSSMYHACATTFGKAGALVAGNWKCGLGCNNGSTEGYHCTVNTENCYY